MTFCSIEQGVFFAPRIHPPSCLPERSGRFVLSTAALTGTAAKAWIIERQLARRNLTKYQKSRLAIAFEPILKEQARERQVQGGREKLPQNSSEAPKDRETRNKVAEIAGVSHDTIAKVKKIDEVADEGIPTIRKHGGYLTRLAIEQLLDNPELIVEMALRLKTEREKSDWLQSLRQSISMTLLTVIL